MIKKINLELDRFYELVVKDSALARKVIENIDYKNDPYLLHCIALTYRDEGMFFKNGKMRKVYLKEKINLAKKFIDKAFKLNSTCRDVLYIKGVIYNAMGDAFTAIDCYIKILEIEENLSNEYNCSHSNLYYVQMILNDSRFQLYRLFYDLENFELSKRFLFEYKKNIDKGIGTIYSPLDQFLME